MEDFNVQSPLIDSNTNAVVVAALGESDFIANTTELTFSLVFKQRKRIKIINKKGFDAATVTIPLYVSSSGKEERLEDLDAFTYNIENGKVVSSKVDRSSVFTEKHNKNWVYKKFTFPSLKEGSIIEYSYQVKSDFFFNLQSWTFQEEYPVLWSQYEAGIPEFYKYVILSQGYQPFFINKTTNSQTSFSFVEHVERDGSGFGGSGGSGLNSFKVDGLIDYHTWVMKNVPALKEEPFTTTLRNSIAKIEFQLNQVAFPHSMPRSYMESWQKVSEEMIKDEEFGVPINRANNWLDDEVNSIVKNATTPKDKTKKIYEYIRDNYTCSEHSGMYIYKGLKDIVKNKNGTVGDLNLLLIAMLRNQRITANPVILSTRNHGFTHEYYPLMDRYNYVIAQVTIGNDILYLDATEPRLAFNKLPLQVYNGHARIISNDNAVPVFFAADSLVETTNTMVFIANNDKGEVEGSLTNNPGYYHALDVRNELAKKNMEEYKKALIAAAPEEVELSNITVDSLKLLDEPLAVKYDLKFKAFGDAGIVYFNPLVGEATKKNPFTAAERFYPVEMPYTLDDIYVLNMEIPKGYKVEELPKSARVMLNDDEGMFEYLISTSNNSIQMRRRLILKKANYTNEDYQTLRDFFGFIVSKEAEQIVFKKIN